MPNSIAFGVTTPILPATYNTDFDGTGTEFGVTTPILPTTYN